MEGFFSTKPPRLEDAGLEDSALSVEGIQEAFRIASESVRSAASDVLGNVKECCTETPLQNLGKWEDALVGENFELDKKTADGDGCCVELESGLTKEVIDEQGNAERGPRLGDDRCVKGNEEDFEKNNKQASNIPL